MNQGSQKSPSISQIKYFVKVAKTLSFRRAAQALKISQPTLTNQIAALEKLLNLQLFERSRSGTVLTPQGRALLSQADVLLQASMRFDELARDLNDDSQTTYRLGVTTSVGPYLLPHILPKLHKKYAQLKFYVREDTSTNLLQGLYNGEYDLILTEQVQKSTQLVEIPLFIEPIKFVMASDHRLAGKHIIDPADIKGEVVLTLEGAHHFHDQVQGLCHKVGAVLHRDYEGTSLDTLRQMVVMGMGSTFLPGLYIHSEIHRPNELQVCELKDMGIVRQHNLMWRNTSSSRVFFRELTQYIRLIIKTKLSDVVSVID
ncbi:hydrogen peroxide-inducible genes activator [Pseudoalteromonas sp. MMG007]|uniref:hydrogen peroxide-inducible genes activator n=1 Tax=Pseudoalteromonas sp. MMG007 TaxID=2822684 RepID=UPI001B39B6C8|nr:hydrogen peroxide-inducible genes activator [Pseudoalteromonas sp. MMG007]MBQ4858608.1 hydrogen peroxide-inducible genes activator [Pseudoalteromonas sp. MMG007]